MTRSRWQSFLFELAVLAALSLWAATAHSAETSPASPGASPTTGSRFCDPADPSKCSTGILQGQTAPYSGQLLTPALAIDLGLKAQFCDTRVALEVGHAKALLQLEVDTAKRLREIDAAASQAAQEALLRRLEAATPWYERPWFVAGVSVAGAVAAYALAMKSVDWIKVSR